MEYELDLDTIDYKTVLDRAIARKMKETVSYNAEAVAESMRAMMTAATDEKVAAAMREMLGNAIETREVEMEADRKAVKRQIAKMEAEKKARQEADLAKKPQTFGIWS